MFYEFRRYNPTGLIQPLDFGNDVKDTDYTLLANISADKRYKSEFMELNVVVSTLKDDGVTRSFETYPHANSQFSSYSTISEGSEKKLLFTFIFADSVKITERVNVFLNKIKSANAVYFGETQRIKAIEFKSYKVKWGENKTPYYATLEVEFIDIYGLWRQNSISLSVEDVSDVKFKSTTFKYGKIIKPNNQMVFSYWYPKITINNVPENWSAPLASFIMIAPFTDKARQCFMWENIIPSSAFTFNTDFDNKTITVNGVDVMSDLHTYSSFFKGEYSEHGTESILITSTYLLESPVGAIRSKKLTYDITGVGYSVY